MGNRWSQPIRYPGWQPLSHPFFHIKHFTLQITHYNHNVEEDRKLKVGTQILVLVNEDRYPGLGTVVLSDLSFEEVESWKDSIAMSLRVKSLKRPFLKALKIDINTCNGLSSLNGVPTYSFTTKEAADDVSEQLKDSWKDGIGLVYGPYFGEMGNTWEVTIPKGLE